MQRIDAHQHFWMFDPVRESWITDEMAAIRKNFLPGDLQAMLHDNKFDGSVVVQCDQSETENEFLLRNAEEFDFIKGVVGWVNLEAANLEERLGYYATQKKMKGFRHVLQSEADRAFMLRPSFRKGIAKLKAFDFAYDILIFEDQLKYLPEFVGEFPDQRFIIDHLAKPAIKDQSIERWEREMKAVANYENVFCKISGLVTEANWKNWRQSDFIPFIDVAVNAFGTKRILFGSDWPVCLVAAPYPKVLEIVQKYFSGFSENERELFFGGNAIRFYNLENVL